MKYMKILSDAYFLSFLNCKLKNQVFWTDGSRVKVLVETGFSNK
jgi:hypothetical protein